MKIKHLVGYALFAWLICGWGFLIYVQNIDGVYIRKPLVFHMNTNAFEVDKPVYHRGDRIMGKFSLCRERNYTAQSTWRLVNETVVTFPTTGTKVLSNMCIVDKWFDIGVIPPYAIPGVHHLEGSSVVTLNPLHQMYYTYRSVEFQVK